jgi:hypothetical protein
MNRGIDIDLSMIETHRTIGHRESRGPAITPIDDRRCSAMIDASISMDR